jgi:uncharacterized protein YrrD
MSIEPAPAVRVIGLPIVDRDGGNEMGVVTDVSVSDEGKIQSLEVRLGWLAGERCLASRETELMPDAVRSLRPRNRMGRCPKAAPDGIVGVAVVSHEGETLGRVANVLATYPDYTVVALELSNGKLRDWAHGRVTVTLPPDDKPRDFEQRCITLSEESHAISQESLTKASDEADASTQVLLPLQKPMDWDRIRQTPEDVMRRELANAVWERRGAPKGGAEKPELLELVSPWVTSLKLAAEHGGSKRFDDLALLTGEQVEAFRVFRVGAAPIERHVEEPSESAPAPPNSDRPVASKKDSEPSTRGESGVSAPTGARKLQEV